MSSMSVIELLCMNKSNFTFVFDNFIVSSIQYFFYEHTAGNINTH